MSDLKMVNFRISSEAADYLRGYFMENGWTTAQGFDHLVEMIEADKTKATVAETAKNER